MRFPFGATALGADVASRVTLNFDVTLSQVRLGLTERAVDSCCGDHTWSSSVSRLHDGGHKASRLTLTGSARRFLVDAN